MEDTVKTYLRVFYTDSDQREAAEYFNNLIESKTECPNLYEILLNIFIKDEDENLKKISLIIIRGMDFEFIFNAILSIFQKVEPKYYYLIEILSDSLVKQKNEDIIPIINDMLSSQNDFYILIAILQIINSLKFLINQNVIQIDDFSKILREYYSHFYEIASTIIQEEEILDEQQSIFMFYFANIFLNSMFKDFFDTQFYFTFSSYILSQKQNDHIHKSIIDIIIDSFKYYYAYEKDIIDLIDLLIEYCEVTRYIPNFLISIWPIIWYDDHPSLDYDNIVLNYIFPFFRFNPDLMIYDQEQFLDEFDPDPNINGDLPLQIFIYLMNAKNRRETEFDSVERFVDFYYKEFIETDSIEICRLFNFFSVFVRPTNIYTLNFFQNEIIPIITSIVAIPNPDVFIIIGICQIIKRISPLINVKTDSNFVTMAPILANFLKWSILSTFDVDENIQKFIFYFSINAITSLSSTFSIEIFEFTEEEAYNIFIEICQLFTEICNDSLTFSFKFLINKMMPLNINVEDFVSMIWELMIQHRDDNLLENLFTVIQNFFINCSNYEDKQTVFNVFFINCLLNEESKDWLIIKCYYNIVNLLVLFTEKLLDDSEKVPFFIESVGGFIIEMLSNINSELYPEFFDNDGSNNIKRQIINEYEYFFYYLIRYIDDPNDCIELVLKPFIIPFIEKTVEIYQFFDFYSFGFIAINAPLIKFKGDEDVFQFLFQFYESFIENDKIFESSKIDFTVSLIIANPSFLFENFNQEQFLEFVLDIFPKANDDLLIYAIKEILVFLCQTQSNDESIEIFAKLFFEKADKFGFNGNQIKEMSQLPYFFPSSLYNIYMYNEDFIDVFYMIFDILDKCGIQSPFE